MRTVVTSEVMSAVLLEPAAALSFSLQSIHYNTIIVPIYYNEQPIQGNKEVNEVIDWYELKR